MSHQTFLGRDAVFETENQPLSLYNHSSVLGEQHRVDATEFLTSLLEEQHRVNDDIHQFIEMKVNELFVYRQYPESLRVHVKEVFQNHAQDTFLWVGIVAKALKKYEATEVEKALEFFPSGLEESHASLLLQIDVDRPETAAERALYRAAISEHKATVQLLLKEGSNVDVKTASVETALERAAAGDHDAVGRLLSKKGTEVAAKDNNDRGTTWPNNLPVNLKNQLIEALATELWKSTEDVLKGEEDAAKRVTEALPELLMEFSLELLLAAQPGIQEDARNFIRQYRICIARSFRESLVLARLGPENESRYSEDEQLSIVVKMSRWNVKPESPYVLVDQPKGAPEYPEETSKNSNSKFERHSDYGDNVDDNDQILGLSDF